MKEAWICPKCNIGVAPRCDTCPNCTKPLDFQPMPTISPAPLSPMPEWEPLRVHDFPPRKPNETVSITTTGTPKAYTQPYDPTIIVKWSFTQ